MTRFSLPRPMYVLGAFIFLNGAFWIMMPPHMPEWLLTLMNSTRGALSLMVIGLFGKAVWDFRKEAFGDSSQILTMGIFFGFIGILYQAIYSVAWQFYDRPDSWVQTPAAVYGSFIISISALCHISAPGAIDGRIPKRTFRLWIIATLLAGLVAGVVIGLRVHDIIE